MFLAETVVDSRRFIGTCSRAANRLYLGKTLLLPRQGGDPVGLSLTPQGVGLIPRIKRELCDAVVGEILRGSPDPSDRRLELAPPSGNAGGSILFFGLSARL